MIVFDGHEPATIVFLGNQLAGCGVNAGPAGLFPDNPTVQERTVTGSADKPELIDELLAVIGDHDQPHTLLCQKTGLMVDEMLENALYAAPRHDDGSLLFSKGQPRQLLPNEQIRLRYCFDGSRLALEVRDTWGSLTASQVFNFLALNTATAIPDPERAGRGLFFMWRFMDQFYVSIRPGVETVVGGCLQLRPVAG